MQKTMNQLSVQVCVLPIKINFLYDKIKINLRQHVLSCQLNSCIKEQRNFEENILESQIIPSNLQFITFNEPYEELSRITKISQTNNKALLKEIIVSSECFQLTFSICRQISLYKTSSTIGEISISCFLL
ncbi:unnamed protein product [Paramecium sonneborni]|uniref:Uncharacterized protein n=1 Tax=Paramecium sonneborni TaxID=65129 RepID=A0A8S1RP65_9CILI|nr:unnamed protein product [Paramecium sonneborni]